MNYMYKKRIIIVFALIFFPLHSLQKTTAHACVGGSAIVSLGLSYALKSRFKENINPIVLGVVGTGLVYFFHSFLYSFTPEGRLKKAHEMLADITTHTLIRVHFEDDKHFFNTLHDVYLTDDLPIIGAYNHLIGLLSHIHYIFGLINHASAEIGKDSLLQEKCDVLFLRAKRIFNTISQGIKRIRAHKDYLFQLKIYKEFLENGDYCASSEYLARACAQLKRVQQSSVVKWLQDLF